MAQVEVVGGVSKEIVEKAVSSLVKHAQDLKEKENAIHPQLLEDPGWIFVQVSVSKISTFVSTIPHPIDIPHRIIEKDADVCLIVRHSRDKFKEMISTGELKSVKKVLDLKKLKVRFGRFEQRRKLVASYDVFLVDHSIVRLMPRFLGRDFFLKKKEPITVMLFGKEKQMCSPSFVNEQVQKALSRTYARLRIGATVSVRAAKLSFKQSDIVENVIAVANGIASMPRIGKAAKEDQSWSNVQSLYIKAAKTLALPIYQSDLIQSQKKSKEEEGQEKTEEKEKETTTD